MSKVMSKVTSKVMSRVMSTVKKKKLARRTLLRGIGGVAVSLPVLECMLDDNGENIAKADSGGLPCRYALLFAGQALGGDNHTQTAYRLDGSIFDETGHHITPASTGSGYEITTPLQPMAPYVDDFSLVSNMRIPYSTTSTDASQVPAGGAYRDFHGGGCSPLLSGTRSSAPAFMCYGPTSDQVVAAMHTGLTHRSLVYRAQVPFYLTGYDHSGRQYISYTEGGRSGRVEAQTSPQNAFMSLFTGFVPPDDTAAAARLDFELRSRRSVLDLIGDKRDRVLGSVGRVDRMRLERHFDEIRQLELQLAATPPMATGQCQMLSDPGPDPSIGADNPGSGASDITSPSTGYSDEHRRARIFADLIHMAFVCDLTRSATLQITAFQSHMSVLPVSENLATLVPALARPGGGTYRFRADLHELGHNGDPDNKGQFPVSVMLGWHLSHYAYLIDKLKNTPEGAGTVLDNSAIVFTPEAGHGRHLNDPDVAADPQNAWKTHSVEGMIMLVAGRAGGLLPGRHIDAAGAHPAQCLVSAMQAVGYSGDTLGEVTGNIPELFG